MRRAPKTFMLLAALAETTTPAAAIVGRARETTNPSVVMVLGRSAGGAGFCSGVVLSANAVLTAAHCARSAADTRVHFKDASGAPVLLDVTRVERHPGFTSDAVIKRARSVDLAIVFTRQALPASFSPASLASATSSIGASFTIAGFGVAADGAASTGGVLRAAGVALRAPASNLLLWLAGDGGACTGDSGGPVLDSASAVVGVIAYAAGTGGKGCGALTQAVRVAPFLDWIESNLGR